MAFPAVGTAVPGLSSYQLSFNGYLMGAYQPLEFKKMEGLDQPDVRSGDAARGRDHGLFIGLDAMGGRTITLTGELAITGTNWQAFVNATVPGGTTEIPLYLNLPQYGTLVTMARVRRRNMPMDIQFVQGLAEVVLQFSSSDPRLYSTPTLNPSVSPPATTAGFSFPMTFPLSFGGGGLAGSLSVTNQGNIETRPILVVTGPCTNPSITNATVSGSPNLTFNLSMNAGDQLFIDTDLHTATYYTSGSSIGSTRLYTLARGSTWFTLQPGANTIQFLTGDSVATGLLTVQYASAYII